MTPRASSYDQQHTTMITKCGRYSIFANGHMPLGIRDYFISQN